MYMHMYICINIYIYIYISLRQRPILRVRSWAASCRLSYDSHIWFQILFTISAGGPQPPGRVDASTLSMSGGAPRGTTETSYFPQYT